MENNYRLICKYHKVGTITPSEFDDVVSNLESAALLTVTRKAKTKSSIVGLNVNQQDLATGIKDSTLLETILEDGNSILANQK